MVPTYGPKPWDGLFLTIHGFKQQIINLIVLLKDLGLCDLKHGCCGKIPDHIPATEDLTYIVQGRCSIFWPLEGNWALFRKFIWKIVCKHVGLEGEGGTGETPLPGPCTRHPLRSRFVYRIFHMFFFLKSVRLPSSG